MYYLTELFKKEENVFVSREDFLHSVGELNLFVNQVRKQKSTEYRYPRFCLVFRASLVHTLMLEVWLRSKMFGLRM